MSKKYVILGTSVYGIENMGDEALLTVLIRELRNCDPECHITWVARHKNEALAKLYGANEVISGLEHETKVASEGRWFNGLNKGDNTEHLKVLADKIKDADVLIIGGDPFQQITLAFNRGLSPYAANLITLAKFLGTKTVLYSIHMGAQLTDGYAKELTKFCIENADLTLLREKFSIDIINDMKINSDTCTVVADSAWALDPVELNPSILVNLPNFNNEWLNTKIVGVNIRHNYWQWSDEKWGRIKAELAEFLDNIVTEYNVKILFIPNCTYDTDHAMEDDRPPQSQIMQAMKNKASAYTIETKLSLRETLSLFPHLWGHISNRRHSAVFAAVHRIPVLPLGGTWHVRPAFEEIDLGMNLIEPEFWSAKNLFQSFSDVVLRRDHIIDIMNRRIPELRKLACSQGEMIHDL
jgi:polysaccharide pyruvyl transferase WcaK-like protein